MLHGKVEGFGPPVGEPFPVKMISLTSSVGCALFVIGFLNGMTLTVMRLKEIRPSSSPY